MTAPLMSKAEVQVYLGGISRPTLDRLVARGELRRVMIGRRVMFHREDVDAFIDRKRQEAP